MFLYSDLCRNFQTFCVPFQIPILKPNPTLLTLYFFSLSHTGHVKFSPCKALQSLLFLCFLQSVNNRLWVQSFIYCWQLPGFSVYSLKLILFLLINATEYLKRDPIQVLTPWNKFLPFNFDFKTFLNYLKYSLETFNFVSSPKNLSASKITRYM